MADLDQDFASEEDLDAAFAAETDAQVPQMTAGDAAIVSGLNAGGLGLGARVLAGQDAMDAVAPGRDKTPIRVPSDALNILGSRWLMAGTGDNLADEYKQFGSDLLKKAAEVPVHAAAGAWRAFTDPAAGAEADAVYERSLPRQRAGFNAAVEQHPVASFGAMLGAGLLTNPTTAGRAAIVPAMTALGMSEADYQEAAHGDVGEIAKAGVGGGMGAGLGALGYRAPLKTGLGVAGTALLAGDALGMTKGEKTQAVAGGALAMGGGLLKSGAGMMSKLSNKAGAAATDAINQASAKPKAEVSRYQRILDMIAERRAKEGAKVADKLHKDRSKASDAKRKEMDKRYKSQNEAFQKELKKRTDGKAKGEAEKRSKYDALTKAEVDSMKRAESESDKALVSAFLKQERDAGRGPVAEGEVSPEDRARALLGNDVQEVFRFLRSKDGLGLKLTPKAEQGAGHVIPDYEAKANAALEKYAEGKGPVFKQLLEQVLGAGQKALPEGTPQDPTVIKAADKAVLRAHLEQPQPDPTIPNMKMLEILKASGMDAPPTDNPTVDPKRGPGRLSDEEFKALAQSFGLNPGAEARAEMPTNAKALGYLPLLPKITAQPVEPIEPPKPDVTSDRLFSLFKRESMAKDKMADASSRADPDNILAKGKQELKSSALFGAVNLLKGSSLGSVLEQAQKSPAARAALMNAIKNALKTNPEAANQLGGLLGQKAGQELSDDELVQELKTNPKLRQHLGLVP